MITNLEDIVSKAKIKHGSNVSFGSSIILTQQDGVYFSMVKPKNWRIEPNGLLAIDFSGIGGGFEKKESPYQCALRELNEEVGLHENDLNFIDSKSKVVIIQDDEKSLVNIQNGKVNPIIIFHHKIDPLHLRQNQARDSYLILFIYVAKIISKKIPKISSVEDIPGLLFVKNSNLDCILRGVTVNKDQLNKSQYKINLRKKYLKYIPPVFKLEPKFTPVALAKSQIDLREYQAF